MRLRASLLRILPLALALAVPMETSAEGRPVDRIGTVDGFSSGIRLVSGNAALLHTRLEIRLHGDHATLRQRYRLAQTDFGGDRWRLGIASGISHPTAVFPGRLRAGHFPSLLVLGERSAPLQPDAPSDPLNGHLFEPLLLRPPAGRGGGETGEIRTRSWEAEWEVGEVLWTVPYGGDSFAEGGPADCSCGSPWQFAIAAGWLAIDPRPLGFANAESATVEVVIHNRTGVEVRLWPTLAPGAPGVALEKGGRRTLVYGGPTGEKGPLVVNFREGWRPPEGEMASPRWKEPTSEFLQSRLREGCRQPWDDTEPAGAGEYGKEQGRLECASTTLLDSPDRPHPVLFDPAVSAARHPADLAVAELRCSRCPG